MNFHPSRPTIYHHPGIFPTPSPDCKTPQDSKCHLCCIQIQNFGVQRNGKQIMRDINLHIHCGEITAILGPNGIGKTTFLKALIGEIPHSGKVAFIDAQNKVVNRVRMGYMPQKIHFNQDHPTSVYDWIGASLSHFPIWLARKTSVEKKVLELLSLVQGTHLIDRRLGQLSGGELQRILLAMALHPIPQLLLLDEPSTGIDEAGLEVFHHLVTELRSKMDLSILLVTHDLNFVAQAADRVLVLGSGQVEFNGSFQDWQKIKYPKLESGLESRSELGLESGPKSGPEPETEDPVTEPKRTPL